MHSRLAALHQSAWSYCINIPTCYTPLPIMHTIQFFFLICPLLTYCIPPKPCLHEVLLPLT